MCLKLLDDGSANVEWESPTDMAHLRVVEETSRALQDAVELEAVLGVALRSVVPDLADLAVLVLEDSPGGPRVEVAVAQPDIAVRLRHQVTDALDAIRSAARAYAHQRGHARWLPVVNDRSIRFISGGDPRVSALLASFDVRSLIVLALRASGRTIGGLALARSESEIPFHATDFAAVQVLGRRIALAVESALLQRNLQKDTDRHTGLGDAIHKWIQVFDLAWWGAAVVDGVDRRIDTVNPAFARLHGYPDPSSLSGRLFSELVPPDRVGELEEWRFDEGKVYETVHIRPDGSPVPVLVSVTPLDGRKPNRSYVVTVQDLTDLKRTEERLQRAQRMEAVGRLAGGVAHEVNNMMTIILGFSDLLTRDSHSTDHRARELEEIRKAAIRAAKITTQLLAFSRQQVLQPVNLRLNAIVEEIVPVLRLMLPANVKVATALAESEISVRADRSQLEQVLINLAFNARDAMVAGGLISITTESRELREADGRRLIGIPIPSGRYGLISVVDNGHGMDETTLAQVFEPFFTTKPVGSGTGLGLSTVYGIVKQSGGYVWVESTEGKGTSFTICLPEVAGVKSEAPRHHPATPLPSGQGGTVLILEDEDGVRELAARILWEQGYRVIQARNGNEALTGLRQRNSAPCLLLTDVVVPDMGAEDLEREVHEIYPELPILYMSGYPRDDILARGLLREEQPFLQKPFTREDLAGQVGRMVNRD